MMSRLGIALMRAVAHLPLSWVRALGHALGLLLYALGRVAPQGGRRQPAAVLSAMERCAATAGHREVFVHVAQSFLDRAWLWHAAPEVVRSRLRLTGAVGNWRAMRRRSCSARTSSASTPACRQVRSSCRGPSWASTRKQSNPVVDAWVLKGRHRFGDARPMSRSEGVRDLIAALRAATSCTCCRT
jgi:KDO2-lipid IV(A) lauroyltransferase